MRTLSKWTYIILYFTTLPTVSIAGAVASRNVQYRGANYSDRAVTVYQYPIAAAGSCIDSPEESYATVLNRNGISVRGGPSSGEMQALAKGIGQIEKLLGSTLPLNWRTPYNYINTVAKGTWNQAVNAINVRRPLGTNQGENVGRLMHEIGHKVGNSGVYGQYRSFIGSQQCGITNYATSKSNEQFAEVFAAYVAYPDKLAKSCPRAYLFFSEKLFPKSKETVATCDNFDRAEQLRWTSSQGGKPNILRRLYAPEDDHNIKGVR